MTINKHTCKKYGFTLSEVLVTIAILGVVAAILIPAVTKIVPKSNKVMFKKAYSTIEQTVEALINDDTIYPADQVTVDGGTGAVYKRGFNYTDDPLIPSNTINKFCYYFTQKIDVIGNTSCPTNSQSFTVPLKIATTSDGINWYILYTNTTNPAAQFPIPPSTRTYDTRIVVDVNGSKGPNCLLDTNFTAFKPEGSTDYTNSCSNPDTFIIGIRYDGKLRIGNSSAFTANTTPTDTNAINILKSPIDNQ